jgi:hypothetical protein
LARHQIAGLAGNRVGAQTGEAEKGRKESGRICKKREISESTMIDISSFGNHRHADVDRMMKKVDAVEGMQCPRENPGRSLKKHNSQEILIITHDQSCSSRTPGKNGGECSSEIANLDNCKPMKSYLRYGPLAPSTIKGEGFECPWADSLFLGRRAHAQTRTLVLEKVVTNRIHERGQWINGCIGFQRFAQVINDRSDLCIGSLEIHVVRPDLLFQAVNLIRLTIELPSRPNRHGHVVDV